MNKNFMIVFLLFIFTSNDISSACTAFMASRGLSVLFGNNEDYLDPDTYIWFRPAEQGKYGCVYFGFGDGHPQGGMNDQGLCFDGFGTPTLPVTQSGSLPYFQGNPNIIIMENCATVAEVIEMYSQHNLTYFATFQLFYVDRTGASAIIEGDSIIYKEGDFQVVTNFYHSHPELGGWPCRRYNTATNMLSQNDEITVDFFRSILDAVHIEGTYATKYSNICDLTQGVVYLYYNHYFDEVIKIDLETELQKGSRRHSIRTLFANLKPNSPDDGEVLNSTSATFIWEGDTNIYQLAYATNSDFINSNLIDIDLSIPSILSKSCLMPILLGMFFMGQFRNKKLAVFLIILTTCILFTVCDKDKATSPEMVYTHDGKVTITIDNLQPKTMYYWKVTAQRSPYFISECMVSTFTTGNA